MGTWSSRNVSARRSKAKAWPQYCRLSMKSPSRSLPRNRARRMAHCGIERVQPLGLAVQGHGRVEQLALDDQPQAGEDRLRGPPLERFQAAEVHGVVHRELNLLLVQVGNGHAAGDRLVLPAAGGVQLLHDPLLVDAAGHHARGWAVALVRAAVIGIWATAAGHAQGDHRVAALQGDGLDVGEDRRLDAAQLVGHVLQRTGGDLLADDLALVGDAEEHEAAQAVGQRADGLGGFGPLAGGSLELHPVGLALGYDRLEFLEIHAQQSPLARFRPSWFTFASRPPAYRSIVRRGSRNAERAAKGSPCPAITSG